MAGQMGKCGVCGRRFDRSKGGYDRKTHRYICPSCRAAGRGMARKSPSIGGTIAKIAFGLMFIAVSFQEPESGEWLSYFLVSMTVALALIAWGVWPWVRFRRAEKRQERLEAQLREEQQLLRREKENRPKTCPNCGATSRGSTCEYCGSRL